MNRGFWPVTLSIFLLGGCSMADGGNTTAPSSSALPSSPAPSGSRYSVFISDLHFGVGRDLEMPDRWHAFEDFRWLDEFRLFLKEIDRLGGGKTDLVLNGDVFELWQSLKDDCKYDNKDLGCTEEEALDRIRRVIESHTAELKALGEFARSGENSLIVVPGNHDAALLFPRVGEAALQAIAGGDRVRLVKEGYWLSTDGLVYAEHGQQIGKEVNKWEKWPLPFIESGGKKHLQRPWGEQFVQAYYNAFEQKYPIIDNISAEGEGIRYGMAAEGVQNAVKDIAGFVNFFVLKVSWDQFKGSLGGKKGAPPEWDVKAVQKTGDKFLLESLPRDHPFYSATKDALDRGELAGSFRKLTDDDIKNICDERFALVKIQETISRDKKATISPCQSKNDLGAAIESIVRARDAVLSEHLQITRDKVVVGPAKPFKAFVFSHTHLAVQGKEYSLSKGFWKPVVINTGAWQRVVTPEQLDSIKDRRGLPKNEVLPALEPEDLPACYSFILVKPYSKGEDPTPLLRYWARTDGKNWKIEKKCEAI